MDLLERVLQRERVHHGGEHAHVVGAVAVDPGRLAAAPDVAAADDHRGLHAEVDDLGELPRHERGGLGVDAVPGVGGGEGLAGELQQDPVVLGRRLRRPSSRSLPVTVAYASRLVLRPLLGVSSPSLYRTNRRTATFSPTLADISSRSCWIVLSRPSRTAGPAGPSLK